MNIRAFLAFIWSLTSLYVVWLLLKNWLFSAIDKFRGSRLTFLNKAPVDAWYKGKWCVITGATSGIGKSTARILAENGVNVCIISRDVKRGLATAKEIKKQASAKRSFVEVICIKCDLRSFQSVIECANEIRRAVPVSILINDAGTIETSFKQTLDGYETQYQTTYLSHFLLTWLLWDTLAENGPSRVVWVSSDLHRGASSPFLPQNVSQWYSGMDVYNRSKLAVVMGTYGWHAKKMQEGNTNVTINTIDPGAVGTNILRNFPFGLGYVVRLFGPFFMKSPDKGSESCVYVALAPVLARVSGRYFAPNCMDVPSSPESYNKRAIDELWTWTEQILRPYVIKAQPERVAAGGAST